MTVLYIVRHAQAEDAGAGGRDHDRPLDVAGQAAARRVGRALKALGAAPELVLCSSARRALETWAALAGELAPAPEASVEAGLYLASEESLLERLGGLPPEAASALLVGHNPGLYELVRRLAPAGAPEALARLARGLGPGAAAAVEFDGPWAGLAAGRGRLAWLVESDSA